MSTIQYPQSVTPHVYFNSAERQQLDADDTEAFNAVSMILICILGGGLLLGLFSLLAVMALL
jgi:hypothetical protein